MSFSKRREKHSTAKSGLCYAEMVGAAGQIYCTECSFIVLIDVCRFEQGFSVRKTSYQCLSCGEFSNVRMTKSESVPNCSCGGTLSKNHQLFCPQCKGDKLQYTIHYFV